MRRLYASFVLAASLTACSPSNPPASQEAPRVAADRAPEAVQAAPAQAPSAAEAEALTRVDDPSAVCMVNNQYMGTPQIPVTVEGKIYYGCCQMCESRLQQDASARLGLDPVSKRSVDKATAVMARDARGRILYFENEENFRNYLAAR